MKLPEESILLRIFIGESDLRQGTPLYEKIVLKARELGLAGATVLRGIMGYGAASRIHTAKLLRLSEDLPVVIEIVDTEEKIERLLPYLGETACQPLGQSLGCQSMSVPRLRQWSPRAHLHLVLHDDPSTVLEPLKHVRALTEEQLGRDADRLRKLLPDE